MPLQGRNKRNPALAAWGAVDPSARRDRTSRGRYLLASDSDHGSAESPQRMSNLDAHFRRSLFSWRKCSKHIPATAASLSDTSLWRWDSPCVDSPDCLGQGLKEGLRERRVTGKLISSRVGTPYCQTGQDCPTS